jgi:hypothetical protein
MQFTLLLRVLVVVAVEGQCRDSFFPDGIELPGVVSQSLYDRGCHLLIQHLGLYLLWDNEGFDTSGHLTEKLSENHADD